MIPTLTKSTTLCLTLLSLLTLQAKAGGVLCQQQGEGHLGTHDTPGFAFGVTVVGTTAYVADRHFGLQIIDVTDPTATTLLGSYDTPDFAQKVMVVGTTAYVADDLSGLQTL